MTNRAMHGPKCLGPPDPFVFALHSLARPGPARPGPARSLFGPARCSLSDRGPARSHFH